VLKVMTHDNVYEVEADLKTVRDKLNKIQAPKDPAAFSPLVQIGETLIVRVDSILAIKEA
jgi:hypothetical protein